MADSPAERLQEWVYSVRRKFHLPHTRTLVLDHDYWRGYEACLEDVEGLASVWGSGGEVESAYSRIKRGAGPGYPPAGGTPMTEKEA